ncbi:MAG TPA: caspase family protein [Oscillatoriales cyanobacterium M59_W2019_021]|nr:caspase family protein [Oscillatoriales cyanobacterium M4454_W2019_049]HIK52823.1 caspase family protein [Oscillatoriales cyanobacterium M59_W2019_021]
MVNHACFAIGINQYEFLQPLRYAQEDAHAFQNCLEEKVALSPEWSWVLTEMSPSKEGRSTHPTLSNIERSLDEIAQAPFTADDVLWCFFSGYGVNVAGQDYLMPIEGNPANVEETGIPIQLLLGRLAKLPTQQVRVFLDMSRPTGLYGGAGIGSEAADLARHLGIATILSCRPHQFSRETSALRHGLFAATLLEALRQPYCTTLAELDGYLRDRLPELSEHHWRPRQDPLTIVSLPQHLQASLFPVADSAIVPAQELPQIPLPAPVTPTDDLVPPTPMANDPVTPVELSLWKQFLLGGGLIATALLLGALLSHEMEPQVTDPEEAQTPAQTERNAPLSTQAFGTTAFGNSAAAMGTRLPEEPATEAQPDPVPDTPQSADSSPPTTPVSATATPSIYQGLLDEARSSIQSVPASPFAAAIATARKIPANDPLYPKAKANIELWGRAIWEIAQSRAQHGQFDSAIAAVKLVPAESPQLYTQARQAIATWTQAKQQQQQVSQHRLNVAQEQVQPGQASSYWRAIATLRQIQPADPLYGEARQLADRLSREMLQIARSRADGRQFDEAIQAAVLVPADTAAYVEAQTAIESWKSRNQSSISPTN